MVDGTLRTISIVYLKSVALRFKFIIDFAQCLGSLIGKYCYRSLIAVYPFADKVVCGVIAYFEYNVWNPI